MGRSQALSPNVNSIIKEGDDLLTRIQCVIEQSKRLTRQAVSPLNTSAAITAACGHSVHSMNGLPHFLRHSQDRKPWRAGSDPSVALAADWSCSGVF